eukprot:scaffold24926_cov67-Phaeocystis_antarctica.AAC.5
MAPKLRSAIRAPERPASDGPTVAIDRNVRECGWQVVIDRRSERSPGGPALPSWARIASTSVAPPPKLHRRGSRHPAAALRLRFRWPDLFSGCAASTDGSALPRALQLARSQRPRKREQRR